MSLKKSSLCHFTSPQSRIHVSETSQEFSAMIEIPRFRKNDLDIRICDDLLYVWGKNPLNEKSETNGLDGSLDYFLRCLPLPKSVNWKYAKVFVGSSCIYIRARKMFAKSQTNPLLLNEKRSLHCRNFAADNFSV